MWNSPATQILPPVWIGGHEGLSLPYECLAKPVSFFKVFWITIVMHRIVDMFNLYAATTVEGGGTKGGKHWVPLSIGELLSWSGVLILMGVKKLPNTRLHWSKSSDFFRSPSIVGAMSTNRFEAILQCVHLVDNANVVVDKDDPTYNKVSKTQWLVEKQNALIYEGKAYAIWNQNLLPC